MVFKLNYYLFTNPYRKRTTKMAIEKINLKVRLILYDKGKILLLKQTKPNGGNYTLVGGNVEAGEYATESLIREAWEEAGIRLKEKDLHLVHVLQKATAKQQRIVLYFKAFRWEGDLRSREPRKFQAAEWFDLDEMPRNLTATVRDVMQQYRNGNLYSKFDE